VLSADDFDALQNDIAPLYEDFQQTVINDMARRLANLDFSSAAWQAQRLQESGVLYKNILAELSKLTGKTQKEIAKLLTKYGVKAIAFDDEIYKNAGLNPSPLKLSPAMVQTLKAGLEKTGGVVNNLTQTTAITSQQAFIHNSDLAYMQVSSGAMSYTQAIKLAIKNVAAQGLTIIDYGTGKKDLLDVAMRRTVLTGVAQTANQLQITRADEMGSDLVAVSAHIGARNKGTGPENHESWQGKIYSRSGTHKKYPNFVSTTGYGTGEGLGGWNCRHSFYPFFEGISEKIYNSSTLKSYKNKKVTYGDKQISFYDATQYQREIERKIRFWKRQAAALDAAGIEAGTEWMKVKQWQANMRNFINQTGLDRQSVREQVLHP
jgi:hypothetical protein